VRLDGAWLPPVSFGTTRCLALATCSGESEGPLKAPIPMHLLVLVGSHWFTTSTRIFLLWGGIAGWGPGVSFRDLMRTTSPNDDVA